MPRARPSSTTSSLVLQAGNKKSTLRDPNAKTTACVAGAREARVALWREVWPEPPKPSRFLVSVRPVL
jgi:hypothetical protein